MKYYAVGETGIRKNWSLNYKLMIEHLFFEVPYLQTSLYMVTSPKKATLGHVDFTNIEMNYTYKVRPPFIIKP